MYFTYTKDRLYPIHIQNNNNLLYKLKISLFCYLQFHENNDLAPPDHFQQGLRCGFYLIERYRTFTSSTVWEETPLRRWRGRDRK